MKLGPSRRLRQTTTFLLVLVATWGSEYAWAKTEIHFWHAMSGHLNGAVDTLAQRFNDRQKDYEVKPLQKGTYAETLTAAIAAYHAETPPHRASLRRRHADHVTIGGYNPRLSIDERCRHGG